MEWIKEEANPRADVLVFRIVPVVVAPLSASAVWHIHFQTVAEAMAKATPACQVVLAVGVRQSTL